jgi:hypothetical protein
MPCPNAWCKRRAPVICGGNITHTQPRAWSDTAPVFHVRPPRTGHWRAGHPTTRRLGAPAGDVLTRRCTTVVTHAMQGLDGRGALPSHLGQQGHAGVRPRACLTRPIDRTGTRSAGGHAVERASAGVCLVVPRGPGGGRSGPGGGRAQPRWPRGRLVPGADQRRGSQGARGEGDPRRHAGSAGGRSGRLGVAPRLRPPGWPWMRRPTAAPGGRGHGRHEPRSDALGRPCGAIPWGAAPPQPIGTRAGPPPHVERDRRGDTPRGPRGQGDQRAPRGGGRDRAGPTSAPPPVGRRPLVPRGRAPTARPAGASGAPGVPALRPWGGAVASAPRGPVPAGSGPSPMTACGRVPAWAPPGLAVRREAIPPRGRMVKPMWIRVHDGLYLAAEYGP